MSSEHRGTERSLYDKLQREELTEAREFLEGRLEDVTLTYEEICLACKASMLFEAVKNITPQDLTRYRQRKARKEQHQRVASLIESDAQAIIEGAAKKPTGVLAQFLRRQLAEHVIARLDEEMAGIDALALSREAARHARVEQVDRKLTIEEERAELERRRIELAERQAELQRDKFGIAAQVWKSILAWCAQEEPSIVEALTRRSEELLVYLETVIESEAA